MGSWVHGTVVLSPSSFYNRREMSSRGDLHSFLDAARSQGTSEDVLIGLLRGRGWPEQDIFRVLSEYYETRSGITVPPYKRSASAKDAFLYLLSFSTLAIWAIGLGSVIFTLIDRRFPDPLSPDSPYLNSDYQMADSLACVIIAYPIYLVTMRYILRKLEIYPEKLESNVRKWLTYIALLIAAAVIVGYLIAFLTSFLRGELTLRFASKFVSALFIAGGIFWYYIGSLGKGMPVADTADA